MLLAVDWNWTALLPIPPNGIPWLTGPELLPTKTGNKKTFLLSIYYLPCVVRLVRYFDSNCPICKFVTLRKRQPTTRLTRTCGKTLGMLSCYKWHVGVDEIKV
jgi:hypothetical protein